MTMACLLVLVLLAGVRAASAANSDVDFSKSVVYGGAQDNDVNAVSSAEFLRNFKKVTNETDLDAQPSEDVHGDVMDRVDAGPRVLRGAHSSLDLPLFQPYKHNTIDTADFSDCALQGEWKPIGVPHEHYTHHAEDNQKEHFHSLHEEPETHQSIAAPNTHSPLDAEGVAFWNQFVKETGNNLHFMHHDKYQKRPNHHHSKKHPPKQRHPPPPKHFYGAPQQRPPAPPPPSPNPIENLDIFSGLRNPSGEGNVFAIYQKPAVADDALLQQSLVAPQQQDLNGIDLVVPVGEQAINAFPPLDLSTEHQSPPSAAAQVAVSPAKFNDESYLSPPPVPPPSFHNKPERPRLQQRPKYIHRPSRPPPPPKYFKGEHRRPPPPSLNAGPYEVSEHSEEHRGGQFAQVNAEHSEEHRGGPFGHVNTDPSTFTCGHEHGEGTNYHTASYQVEGEADPSLLEDEIVGANHHLAPIIVGQPIFDQEGPSAPFEAHRLSEEEVRTHDLAEEGTETGEDSEAEGSEKVRVRPFADKLISSSRAPESSTQSSTLETTAPQTFKPEFSQNQKIFSKDSQSAPTSSFHIGFDHSGFSDVGIHHANHKPSFESNSKEFTFSNDPDFQRFKEQSSFPQHSTTFSEPNNFFSTSLGPKFPNIIHGSPKPGPATSFTDFSFSKGPSRPSKGNTAVFDHTPQNETKPKKPPPRKKHPQKPYEVSEESGERIPLSVFFPPKKMPKQFDMRMPNFANPNGRPRPAPPGQPPQVPKNLKSTVQYDGTNLGVYTTHPRNKVTKIRLKMKGRPGGHQRFSDGDYRKGVTFRSRSH